MNYPLKLKKHLAKKMAKVRGLLQGRAICRIDRLYNCFILGIACSVK